MHWELQVVRRRPRLFKFPAAFASRSSFPRNAIFEAAKSRRSTNTQWPVRPEFKDMIFLVPLKGSISHSIRSWSFVSSLVKDKTSLYPGRTVLHSFGRPLMRWSLPNSIPSLWLQNLHPHGEMVQGYPSGLGLLVNCDRYKATTMHAQFVHVMTHVQYKECFPLSLLLVMVQFADYRTETIHNSWMMLSRTELLSSMHDSVTPHMILQSRVSSHQERLLFSSFIRKTPTRNGQVSQAAANEGNLPGIGLMTR